MQTLANPMTDNIKVFKGEKANAPATRANSESNKKSKSRKPRKKDSKSRKSPHESLLDALSQFLEIGNKCEELDEFEETFKNNIQAAHNDKDLFHIMAKSWTEGPEKRKLLHWMLQQRDYQNQLVQRDKRDFTPMHNALIDKKYSFVNDVLVVSHIDIVNVLRDKSPNGNCLHLATKHSFPYLSTMINKCTDYMDIFMEGENSPNGTPLHIAVNMIQHSDDEEEDEEDDEDDEDEDEDYDEDESESNKETENPNSNDGYDGLSDKKRVISVKSEQEMSSEGGSGTSKEEDENHRMQSQKVDEEIRQWIVTNFCQDRPRPPSRTEDETWDIGREGVEKGQQEENHSSLSQRTPLQDPTKLPADHSVRLLLDACPEALTTKNKAGRTPYQEREHFLLNDEYNKKFIEEYAKNGINNAEYSGTKRIEENGDTEENRRARAQRVIVAKDPIAHYIRSFCMHNSKSRDEIMERLYKPGHECHIEFDLEGMPTPTIKHEYLYQLEKHLKFESTLRYVALPALSIESPPSSQRNKLALSNDTQSRPDRHGRSDLVAVFDWLWRGGVREIIKVMVVDDGKVPHADTAIVEALYGFKIEEWDWKRVDLCSNVIYESSPTIREVSLYSSGNNAVLMSWASEAGLVNDDKFSCLEKVKVYVQDGLEDYETWLKNTTRFQRIIEERAKGPNNRTVEVKIIPDNNPVKFSSELSATEHIQETPVWIKSIQEFSTFLMNASQEKQNKVPPVKIAIIDDGIDATMHDLHSKIAGGATFCPYPHSPMLVNSYYVPRGNHGTLMAQLICSICPSTQLYIARLEELPTLTGSGRSVTARSAAKAVDWAISCGVNIISMSWTIQTAAQDNADMEKLKQAINKAHEANILMFCSASDQGGNTKESYYPGGWNQCLRIGGATFTGEKLTWVNDEVDFWFPGRNVPFLAKDGKSTVYESGSSIATAAASGLAGVLIYSERLRCDDTVKDQDNPFQRKDVMKTAFEVMASGKDGKFPRPYDFFTKNFKKKILQTPKYARKKNLDIKSLDWDDETKEALKALLIRIQDKI